MLRRNAVALAAIVGLAAVSLGVAFYVLRHERLRLPYDPIYTLRFELSNGQALTPGQGQSATVAGVRVGEISKVQLRDGRAVVSLALDRRKLPEGDIRSDAQLLIRPRTPLQDMTVEIDPGSPRAPRWPADAVLGISHSTPSVNLDEIVASLDTDTRAWLQTTFQASGLGLKDRGAALRAALKANAPTLAAARRVSTAVAGRRAELARAVHNLDRLAGALSHEDRGVQRLVTGGDATFRAFAAENAALRSGVAQLPATLDIAREALDAARPFARAAGPAFDALVPAAKLLPGALRQADPLLRDGTPALRQATRLTTAAAPVLHDAHPAVRDLGRATPDLTTSFSVLRRAVNELAYVPGGGQHGYLYWLAWFQHNMNSFLSGEDANGAFWRGNTIVSCSGAVNNPVLIAVLGSLVNQLDICPKTSS